MIPLSGILDLTAQAASKGEYDVKVRWRASWTKGFSVRNPHDNKTYSVSGHGTIIYIDGVTAYCLQLGAPSTSNSSAILQAAGMSDDSYFNDLPRDTREQIALILGLSQDLGTSGHEKYVYDYAKQVLIWQSTLNFRNYKTFEYNKPTDKVLFNNIGNGSGAADGVDLTAREIGAAYAEIENRVKEYLKNPTNTERLESDAKVAAQMVPTKVPAPTPDNPNATKIEKWTADIKDPTWKYTDIALFNSSPTAQKYKMVMSMLPDNAGVHIEMPHPTKPDGTPLDEAGWNTIKAEIEAAVFQADKIQNNQLKAITGGDFYCYATEDPKDQKMIAGTPKAKPIPLFFKVSFDQLPPETPDPDPPPPDPPKPPKIDVPGQKYGEYDDAGGLGGATIVLYQTAGYEEIKVEDGEEKPEVPEYELVQYDKPKKSGHHQE